MNLLKFIKCQKLSSNDLKERPENFNYLKYRTVNKKKFNFELNNGKVNRNELQHRHFMWFLRRLSYILSMSKEEIPEFYVI